MFQNILNLLFLFLAILVMVSLGGRLLGLRISFLRGLITALLGLGFGIALAAPGRNKGTG